MGEILFGLNCTFLSSGIIEAFSRRRVLREVWYVMKYGRNSTWVGLYFFSSVIIEDLRGDVTRSTV